MKMIVFVNNLRLEKKIYQKYKDVYYIVILKGVEEILDNIQEEDIVIIRCDTNLQEKVMCIIGNIKKKGKNIRVVVIVDKLTEDLKEKLFAKEVFNIVEGKSFSFEELVECIDSPKMVVYKNKTLTKNNSKIIIVSGIEKSGKTFIAKLLAQSIAKNKDKKILVLDFNFMKPCLDIYTQCEANYSLSKLIEDVKSNVKRDIRYYESIDKKYENLKYILNFKCISVIDTSSMIQVLKYLKDYYDYIIVDTASIMLYKMCSVAKELNANIVYVMIPSIKSVREFRIDTLFLEDKVVQDMLFIVNEYKKKNIIQQIKKYSDINIYGTVKWSRYINYYIDRNVKIVLKYNIRKLLKQLGIVKFEKIRSSLIEKIINIEEE